MDGLSGTSVCTEKNKTHWKQALIYRNYVAINITCLNNFAQLMNLLYRYLINILIAFVIISMLLSV